jgi:hypothetical protein
LLAEDLAAHPGAWYRGDDKGKRVPFGTERRSAIPGGYRTRRAQDQTDNTQDHGVLHGPVRCEPCRDVTAQDPVDEAIERREQEEPLGHRLAHGWEYAGSVEHRVGCKRKDDDGEHTSEDGGDAAADAARRLNFGHDMGRFAKDSLFYNETKKRHRGIIRREANAWGLS